MRIFPARNSERSTRTAGFTLIELLVVLALLSVTLVMVMPALNGALQSEREREISRLSRLIRMIRNESVLTSRRHRILFDLRNNVYAVEWEDAEGGFLPFDQPKILRPHQLPESLRMIEVLPGGEGASPLRDRSVQIIIDSSGFIDPFTLLLREGKALHAIRVATLMGRIDRASGDDFNPPRFSNDR